MDNSDDDNQYDSAAEEGDAEEGGAAEAAGEEAEGGERGPGESRGQRSTEPPEETPQAKRLKPGGGAGGGGAMVSATQADLLSGGDAEEAGEEAEGVDAEVGDAEEGDAEEAGEEAEGGGACSVQGCRSQRVVGHWLDRPFCKSHLEQKSKKACERILENCLDERTVGLMGVKCTFTYGRKRRCPRGTSGGGLTTNQAKECIKSYESPSWKKRARDPRRGNYKTSASSGKSGGGGGGAATPGGSSNENPGPLSSSVQETGVDRPPLFRGVLGRRWSRGQLLPSSGGGGGGAARESSNSLFPTTEDSVRVVGSSEGGVGAQQELHHAQTATAAVPIAQGVGDETEDETEVGDETEDDVEF